MLIKRKHIAGIIFSSILIIAAWGCSGSGGEGSESTRSFHLGFTPFPYDISQEAVDYVYAAIADDADIIAHHFDDGVPWPELTMTQMLWIKGMRIRLSIDRIPNIIALMLIKNCV